MSLLRLLARYVSKTPLHPQWLLGPRRLPAGLAQVTGSVLDVGSGDRWVSRLLLDGIHYVALDFPSTGRDLYQARPDVFADAASLPFGDSSFDAVICLEVLEHVPVPATVLGEIARVMKPGGAAWISMPFLYPVHDSPYDFQRYTEFGLRRDLASAGLELVALQHSLHSLRSAGLLACLAIAGGVSICRSPIAALLAAPAVAMVLAINLLSFALSLVWPDWPQLTAGHDLKVRKP